MSRSTTRFVLSGFALLALTACAMQPAPPPPAAAAPPPAPAPIVAAPAFSDQDFVSRAVAGLTKRGLVERATDRNDRRRASLKLSARGRAMHGRIVPLALAYEEKLYQVLDPAERRAFDALSDRLFARTKTLRADPFMR